MNAKIKISDSLKMLLVNITLAICLIGLIAYTVMDRKGMFDEKVFVDTVTELEKYAQLVEFIQTVKTPTLYDTNESTPFKNVLAGYTGGEVPSSYVEYKLQQEDLYFSYTALSALPEYEELIKGLEPVFEEGSVAVYESQGLYFWKNSNVYYLVKEHVNPSQAMAITTDENGEIVTNETTNIEKEEVDASLLTKEVMQEIVVSQGNSKFEPNESMITYEEKSSILQPSHYVDGKVATEISVETVPDAHTVIHFIYDQYSISQSSSFDYTTLIDKEKAEKLDVTYGNVYVSEDKKQFYYYDETMKISVMLNVMDEGIDSKQVGEILYSMLHEKTVTDSEETK